MPTDSPATRVFTNDVILDTLFEYVTLGSWIRLTATNKDIRSAFTRMAERNWLDPPAQ